ncbi:MAG: sugar ABC transporter permease [Nocardioidaceae bacterium]
MTLTEPSRITTGPPSAVPPSRGQGRIRASWDRHWYAWAMVLPVVVVLGLLILYPLVQGIYTSFTNTTDANQQSEICTQVFGGQQRCEPNPDQAHWIGLDNYRSILTSDTFWLQLENTFVWTVSCVFFHYTIGMGLALLLNRPLRGRSLYRVLLIVPWAVPAFVSAFAWRFLFTQNPRFGLINHALTSVGLDSVAWSAHRWTSLFTAIVTNVWLGVPFMMVALLGGLQAIPGELYEAAEIDGASPVQRFFNVTLPGLRPVSLTVILLGTIWTFNMFPIIYLVTNGQPAGQTEILVTGSFKAAFAQHRYGYAAAYGVVILAILLVFATVYRRALRTQGGTESAW